MDETIGISYTSGSWQPTLKIALFSLFDSGECIDKLASHCQHLKQLVRATSGLSRPTEH